MDEDALELRTRAETTGAERDRLRTDLEALRGTFGADLIRQLDEVEAERDRLRAVVEAALEVVRPMADSACDADVLRIADLYRILAGPALDTCRRCGDQPMPGSPWCESHEGDDCDLPDATMGAQSYHRWLRRHRTSPSALDGSPVMGGPLDDEVPLREIVTEAEVEHYRPPSDADVQRAFDRVVAEVGIEPLRRYLELLSAGGAPTREAGGYLDGEGEVAVPPATGAPVGDVSYPPAGIGENDD